MNNQLTFTNPKKLKISTFIGILLIIVFILFNMNILTNLPCENNISNIFASTFTHIEVVHLLSNLFALYTLSRVENDMGSKSFAWLLIFLITFNTLVEYLIKNICNSTIKCSIGFSGILFGIMTWEIISEKNINLDIILSIVAITFGSSFNTNIATESHVIGAMSGIVGALLWKSIHSK